MNFNFHNTEYDLFRSMTEEVIQLYGFKVKYIITEKINQDEIFGEHSHIKVDSEKVFEFYAMPSESSNWEGDGDLYSKFGLQNLDSISIFIGRSDMEKIHPEIVNRTGKASIENLPHGNLVIFDNHKIMEVTDMKLTSETFGNNNVYSSNNIKNVYKLTLKTYFANRDDYEEADDIAEFSELESIFNEESEQKENIKTSSEEKILEDEVIYPANIRKKPIRVKTDSVFGELG